MEDLRAFASAFPRFCDRNAVRVPGRGALPSLEGARPFEMGAEHLAAFRVDAAKDPDTLPAMLRQGPEAVAFYVSFRLEPDRWGIYLRERGIKALQEEYHRILWRDLGKYADRDIGDVAERVEYSLVLDYLLTHARFHFLVDRTAAAWEKEGGSALYAPYQETWYVPPAKPVAQRPEDIGNLEEALANLDAFRTYINPSYGEGVALMVDGKLDPRNVDDALRDEIMSLNTLDLVCDKHELDWPIKGWKLNVPNILRLLFNPEGLREMQRQALCGVREKNRQ